MDVIPLHYAPDLEDGITAVKPQGLRFRSEGHYDAVIGAEHDDRLPSQTWMEHLLDTAEV